MDSGSVSEEEVQFVLRSSEPSMSDLLLPVLPSSIAECCGDKTDEDNSVWSRSTRVASMSWDWDEPPLVQPHVPSPTSGRCRGRADSSCSSATSPPFCRPTSLSFAAGESARPEYSSPRSPGFVLSSRPIGDEINGDELEGLLADAAPARRQRTTFPFPNRPTTENQKEVIRPLDLAEGEYDYQGIPWPRFSISRADYRTKRVREYSNYNNVNWTAQLEMQRRLDITRTETVRTDMFSFSETYKTVNPTIDHFQLRHLVWSTNNVVSYVASNSTLYEFNKRTRQSKKVQACNPQQLASCHVDCGLAVTGSFDSEVKISSLAQPGVTVATKVSSDPNSITNHVVIADSTRIVVANNDSHVSEVFLADGGAKIGSKFRWTTAVNHVSVSPSGNLLCLTGDSCDVSLMDRRSGRSVTSLSGHLDFSFCSSWRGDNLVCTGSQDGTCRVWDIRNSTKSVACLGSLLGAVRCAKFSPDGRYLAVSEPADFVHVYDVTGGLREVQLLDFFGNIGGIAFSPDGSRLTVALADTMFGCLVDFQTSHLPLNTYK